MGSFIVDGNIRLQGTIETAGNKNEALPLIAAALICDKAVTFDNMPDIGDVQSMLAIARHLGATVSPIENGVCSIKATTI